MIHPLPQEFSEYLDAELPAERAAMLERHVGECPQCAELLDQLRRVVARAQALDDRPPRQDLWPGVAAAIGAAPRGRRVVAFTWPTLLAASLALMLGTAGTVLLWQRLGPAQPTMAADTTPGAETLPVGALPERGYAGAVRALEQELRARRGRLDTATVRILEEKLALIDHAIAEAERALAADPANGYLAGHLARTRLRKLDLLRRAAFLNHAVS